MTPAQQIKQLLIKLTAQELREIELLAEQYRSRKGLGKIRAEDELLYSTLIEVLSYKTKSVYSPFPIFKKNQINLFKKFKDVSLELDFWIKKHFPNVTRTQKRRLYTIFVELVVDFIDAGPVPLGVKTVINSFQYLPGLIDKSFPGYLEAGVLELLLDISNSAEEFK